MPGNWCERKTKKGGNDNAEFNTNFKLRENVNKFWAPINSGATAHMDLEFPRAILLPGIFGRIRDGGTTNGAQLIHLHNTPVRRYCGGTASLFAKRRQINIEVVCDGRQIGRLEELAPKRQDNVNAVGLRKVRSLKKMGLDGTLVQEQDQQQMSASPSQKNTSALEHIVSNLLGVFGSLAKTAMQGQVAAAGLLAEKSTGYTANAVAIMRGLCHIFKPRYVPDLWKEWGKTNYVLTGRNILMNKIRIFHEDGYQDRSVNIH